MGLLATALKLALKAKMAKDVVTLVQDVLPESVKDGIAITANTVTGKVQEATARLLATHAPEFSRKVAHRADPKATTQADTLEAMNAQLKELAAVVKASQNQTQAASIKSRN